MSAPLERARRLLALASSSNNPNEAATAYAAAQNVMAAHALSMEQVRVAADRQLGRVSVPEPALMRIVWTAPGRTCPTWVNVLALALTEVNGCAMIWHTSEDAAVLRAWGRASDLDLLSELLATIPGQIDALCDRSPFRGRTERNNFRLGAARTVSERLRAEAQAARAALEAAPVGESTADAAIAECTAIALRNLDDRGRLAHAARAVVYPRITKSYSRSRSNEGAYAAGRTAGQQVNTSRGRALTGGGL